MKVKIIRIADDYVLNIRYIDELIGNELEDDAEADKAESAIKTVGRYYLSADIMLIAA